MKIRVLLVDDSGFMRIVLTDILNSSEDIEVADTATDGKEAVDKTVAIKPDVVLLDLTMKDYDGLYAVKNIMQKCPTPIVMLSSMGNTNPDAYVEALEAGAIDFLNKPAGLANSKIRDIDRLIYNKIRSAAKVDVKNLPKQKAVKNTHTHTFDSQIAYDAIVIAASTGGTGAIEHILSKLPENLPLPIVIAQHMPAEFVYSFASRLDEAIALQVKVATVGESLKNGVVYIAPGDMNIKLEKLTKNIRIAESNIVYKEFNHPSADALLESAAEVYGARAIGIILTGMGKDGAEGLEKMKKKGALTIGQDEASCVVWGMPKAAYEAGAVSKLLPLNEIATYVVSAIS